jgi:hypothetical protein
MAVAAKGVKAVAGPAPVDSYSTDASGKMTPNYRPDNTRSRLERLAQHALEGLAAGSQIGPQKNAGAAWGAGIGAGAQAEMQKSQGQDLLARKQAQEAYETEQKTLTDKAVRAMHNASTYSLHQKAMDEQNDHDPERKKNMDVVNAVQEHNDRNPGNGISVQIVTPEAAMAIRENDNHSVGKHTFLPVGTTQAKDQNGKPLFEPDGVTPKQTWQIAVLSGDGKIPLPQSFVDDVKEYGKLAGIAGTDQLKAGTEVTLSAYLNADKRMNDVKVKEVDGWKNAHDVILSDGKTHAQMNTVTSKTRPYPEGAAPNVEDKPAAQAVETDLKKSQIDKNEAEAAKARQADNKPVYAFNTQTKQLEQSTRGTVAANPTLYTNPVEVKESDIRKDTELARQLGDAQLNLSRYRAAVSRMEEASYLQNVGTPGGSKRAMASLLGEDKFKAEFMGMQLPADWFNKLADTENWNALSKSQQDAVVGYLGARGAVIAYQKAVSGSGRANKEQLELELQNIPTPLLPKDVRESQFDRFQQNIDQTGAGLPKMVGIERPKEIQQRIEAEEAQKQGATHVYDPNEKKAVPVGTWIQRHFQGMPGVKP